MKFWNFNLRKIKTYNLLVNNMLDRLNNYIDDKKFKLIYEDNLIDIINYTRLITIENNYVSLYINNKKIIIKGKELILKKLLDNELLLNGEVTSLEVVND